MRLITREVRRSETVGRKKQAEKAIIYAEISAILKADAQKTGRA